MSIIQLNNSFNKRFNINEDGNSILNRSDLAYRLYDKLDSLKASPVYSSSNGYWLKVFDESYLDRLAEIAKEFRVPYSIRKI